MSPIVIGLTILAILLLGYSFILYKQRVEILNKVGKNEKEFVMKSQIVKGELPASTIKEGLSLMQAVGLEASSPNEEASKILQQLQTGSSSQIQSFPDAYKDLSLRECAIKSSYNSAISGKYASSTMIKNVLQRGCRFLDFQILSSDTDAKDYVSIALENQTINLDTENKLPLAEAMNTVSAYGFSNAPNAGDPLFIHLRVMSKNPATYSRIAKTLSFSFDGKLFPGKVDKDTKLGELLGKAVIIFDKTTNPEFTGNCDGSSAPDCKPLASLIHMYSGTTELRKYEFQQLLQTSPLVVHRDTNGPHNDMPYLRMSVPPLTSTDTDVSPIEFMSHYPCQMLAMRFSIIDDNLIEYESIFNRNQCAFIPLPIQDKNE